MNEEKTPNIQMTEFDSMVAEPRLQMIKAAIPYLPLPQQRLMSIMVKMQELNHIRSLYAEGELSAMGLSSGSRQTSFVEIIQAMKPYAGPKEREMIEMFENLQIMLQAMQTT